MSLPRAELDRLCDLLNSPSGVFVLMATITPEVEDQLNGLLPNRHFIAPPSAPSMGDLRVVVVADQEAAAITKFIFDEDEPTQLTVMAEHEWRRNHGPWPWEAGR